VKLKAGPAATATRTGEPGTAGAAVGGRSVVRAGEVDSALDRGDQAGQGGLGVATVLGHRDEPEVAVRPCHLRVAPQHAEDGNTDRVDGLSQHRLVAVAPDTVEHDPRDPDAGIEGREAVNECGGRAAHRGGVDDEHDGRVEQLGHLGGAGRLSVGRPVEEPHHALDDEDVATVPGARRERGHGGRAAHPCVEIAWRPAGGESMKAGIDVVGTDLGCADDQAPMAQGPHQPGGYGRLADAGVGAGHDEPRAEPGPVACA
jgi:hypothetical protein